MINNFKKITIISILTGTLFLTGCTSEEEALAGGIAVGVVAGTALASYDYPYYYDRPYYYYGGRYYYGGYYYNGCYHYHGHRYYNGHYYNNGYRYYNGRRYRAQSGHYGYYRNKNEYNRYRKNSQNGRKIVHKKNPSNINRKRSRHTSYNRPRTAVYNTNARSSTHNRGYSRGMSSYNRGGYRVR